MTMRAALASALAALIVCACQPPASGPAAAPSVPAPTATPAATQAGSSPGCGQRIDKDFVLSGDLSCTGDGLVVVADGVTVDLGGKRITGPGMGPQTWPQPQLDSVGVRVEGMNGVTVKNGAITGFSTAVYFVRVTDGVIEGVSASNSRYGLYVHDSTQATIRGNTVERNIYGLHLQNTSESLVEGNDLSRQTYNSPGGYGIYFYEGRANRVIGNTIDSNVNWGVWYSNSRENVFFHNNVVGNRPQVSDSRSDNVWHDPATKQGNWWADHEGTDGDGDGIADTPYPILGAGQTVDPYPFTDRDGWKTKSRATVDHYRPPPPRSEVGVRVVAVAGGRLVAAGPRDARAASLGVTANEVALATDTRTLYALDGRSLVTVDAGTGAASRRLEVTVDGSRLVANRDGRNAFVIGSSAGEQIDVRSGTSTRFPYEGAPGDVAASYKHNQMFVATHDGIDMLYVRSGTSYTRGGHVPYTIPLGGPPVAMAMSGSGTRIYAMTAGSDVVQIVDTEQLTVIDRFSVGASATAMAVGTSESVLYVTTADGVLAIDLPSKRITARTPLPGTAVDAAVSPNGDELYVALKGARLGIAVLSVADLAIVHVIGLDAEPSSLVVATI
ncbi:MAG TPA: NosD domain-containing protein [Gemmatimonadaceae bacterium]|nr:NosD domain-containing protein [Gemmatimonadaceae bacterium]